VNLTGLSDCIGNFPCLITQLTSAVVIAMILFLVASGLSLIFGVLGIGNFAHGSFYMIGAYITYTVMSSLGYFWLALVLAPVGVGLLGLIVERFLVRRIYGSPHIYQFLLTFGLLLVLDDAARFVWGFDYRSVQMAKFFQRPPFFFLGSPIPFYYLFIITVGILVPLGLWIVLSRTKFGKRINAAASDPDMTECIGIDVRLIYTLVFALGAMLAGLGGFLASPIRSATPGMGFSVIIESFIVMVIGGVGSIGGVLIASLLVGLVRSFGVLGFPDFELFFVFFLVIVVLIIRPWGIFGRPLES
jgi:branched-chain amino acid transport system permease protein